MNHPSERLSALHVSAPLLRVEALETGYGPLRIVRGVSFDVAEHEILTIIGANGVGKTTMLKAISGQLPIWSGTVTFAGRPISGLPAHRILAAGVALVPEGRKIFAELSIEENLLVGAHTRSRDEIADSLAHWLDFFPVLGQRRRARAGSLSGGQQQMLALARALMSRPRILLLDEPSLGLAPKIVEDVFDFVGQIRAEGTSVVLVEQNARLALERSDRAIVMQRGEVVIQGPSAELAEDPRVRDVYLGHAVDPPGTP